jgi:hypothetical protein
MQNILKPIVAAIALGTAALLTAGAASAHDYRRSSSVSVYIDTGNIAVGYTNGYYDYGHRWHSWRSREHYRAYCHRRHGRCYNYSYRHDRGRHYGHRRGHHRGWRDDD